MNRRKPLPSDLDHEPSETEANARCAQVHEPVVEEIYNLFLAKDIGPGDTLCIIRDIIDEIMLQLNSRKRNAWVKAHLYGVAESVERAEFAERIARHDN